ncbi:MAG: polysaccharide export protein [Candidatus Sphingomonas phytovorans]|nr:polysaccharide biosynthesis/export family protein [Sphingomonas sp.]WEJ99502.1 MAG: polysaccharide export protein [Sphingomonas sp.]
MLSGCASIPASGPTSHDIVRSVRAEQNQIGMRLVDIDPTVISDLDVRNEAADHRVSTIASLALSASNDVVGPGDVLSVGIYEVGASLFQGGRSSLQGDVQPSASSENFPNVVVARDGTIKLPYAGTLQVAGLTPAEIQARVEHAYLGKSQSLQAIVLVKENLSQTIYVSGDVRRPGRINLSLQRERLLDAIASAGGSVTQTQDMVVRFVRGGQVVEERLDRIQAGAPDDLVLVAGDRIELVREPQTFTVFGAVGKVSQVSFDQTDLTLAEAVARAGGPNDATANPRAVYLFRFDPPVELGQKGAPTIYRLDMMQPQDYFLAQHFAMRNKDVLYVSNAAINRTAKFVAIINQLFSPFVAARTVAQ